MFQACLTFLQWLPLENVKKGDVHIKLVWMYLANDPMVLEKVRFLFI